MARQLIFAAIKTARNNKDFTTPEVTDIDNLLDRLGVPRDAAAPTTAPAPPVAGDAAHRLLTVRAAQEIVSHEAIVPEAYKDSVGVWTWGIGVTSASGHDVARYKDAPQTISKVLEVYIWLLRNKYIPDVLTAFSGHALTEAQFAAALSFHYNTGAIRRASWVSKFKAGDIAGAKAAFMEWRKPPEIIKRRTAERDLFFDGRWTSDGKATVYPVRKPSYSPNWGGAQRVDISTALAALLAA